MPHAFINARLAIDRTLVPGRALIVDGDRIAAIVPATEVPADLEAIDCAGGILAPGLIDTQVNGGGGVLFNDAPTVEAIAAIGDAHAAYGTTAFLPTLISDDLAVVDRAMRAVEAAIDRGVPGVLGIHIEGPFLNRSRHGIHDVDRIRPLDAEGIALITSLRRGVTMVTLAPEETTPQTIAMLADHGVIVSAGHSDATYQQASDAFAAGVRGVTHLFNAMSPLTSRAPGLVGAALERDDVWCGIIVDGVHVHPAVLRLALRARSLDHVMLVTDAMPTVGSTRKSFVLDGRPISAKDGVCMSESGTLAGSDLDMATAVRNARGMLGLTDADALHIGASTAATFLGLAQERGRLRQGLKADLVLFDDAMQPRLVYRAGESFAGMRSS